MACFVLDAVIVSFHLLFCLIILILFVIWSILIDSFCEQVKVDDLGLTREEIQILIAFVGKRFNPGRRELKLTADKFPNRVENKRYVTLLLEQIIAEVRKLNAERSKYM